MLHPLYSPCIVFRGLDIGNATFPDVLLKKVYNIFSFARWISLSFV